ncbi:hypothetical protein DFJ73DRAFT_966909, partial [Zopfochytrium polystomum]
MPLCSASSSQPRRAAVTTTTTTTTTTTLILLALGVLSLLISNGQRIAAAGTSGVPTVGKFVLGAWVNYEEYPDSLDTPATFNKRLGYNVGSFQVRQSIPPIVRADGTKHLVNASIFDDGTDASIFITIYADQTGAGGSGLDLVTQAELTALAQQLSALSNSTGRAIIMRYLPEFNGDWMLYGGKPTAFVANWKLMAATMRSIAPDVKLVWSPNFNLDSSGDSAGGTPYWPGAENVDIVGTSQYWKSSQKAINTGAAFAGNVAPGATFFADSITYVYNTYAKAYNKPFIISEASAAWESTTTVQYTNSVTQPELQFDFWSQVFTAFTSGNFPLFSMAQVFEYDKFEDAYQRDFRATWDPATRNRFVDSLQTLITSNKVVWANSASGGASSASSGTATKAPTQSSAVVTSTNSPSSSKSAAMRRLDCLVGLSGAAVSAALAMAYLRGVPFSPDQDGESRIGGWARGKNEERLAIPAVLQCPIPSLGLSLRKKSAGLSQLADRVRIQEPQVELSQRLFSIQSNLEDTRHPPFPPPRLGSNAGGLRVNRGGELLDSKNVGVIGGIALLVNSMTGPGIPQTQAIYQQSGWLVVTLLFCVFGVAATLCSLFIVEAIQAVPGNKHFQGTVEFGTLIAFFFGPAATAVGVFCLYASFVASAVSAAVLAAQTFDGLFLAVFGRTCALTVVTDRNATASTASIAAFACVGDYDALKTLYAERIAVSYGLLALIAVAVPQSFREIKENLRVQLASFAVTLVILIEWLATSAYDGLDARRVPAVGDPGGFQGLVGIVLMNFAFVTSVPSWINVKKSDVNVQKTLWISSTLSTAVYILVGCIPALAVTIPQGSNFVDQLLQSDHVWSRIFAFAFSLTVLLPSIPLFFIMARANLTQCSPLNNGKLWSTILIMTHVIPWILVVPLAGGGALNTFNIWTSLIFVATANFIFPLAIYLKAVCFREAYNETRALSERQKRILKAVHAKSKTINDFIDNYSLIQSHLAVRRSSRPHANSILRALP